MAVMNMIQALNSAHDVMMKRDENIVDKVRGGRSSTSAVWSWSPRAFRRRYGKTRVFDTPISENGIVATAVGMAAYGLRPVAEIQFADYIYPAYDQIVSEDAPARRLPNCFGEWNSSDGRRIRSPLWRRHFRRPDIASRRKPLFAHVAGVKTVIPSNPADDIKGPSSSPRSRITSRTLLFEPKRIMAMALFDEPIPDRPMTPWSSSTPACRDTLKIIAGSNSAKPLLCAKAERLSRSRYYGTMVQRRALATITRDPGIGCRSDRHLRTDRSARHRSDRTVGSTKPDAASVVVLHEATRTKRLQGRTPAALVQSAAFFRLEGAGTARDGVRHALSALARMGLFPRPGPDRNRDQKGVGGLMARFEFRLPDIGEGIAEAEIVAWHVKVGDEIGEDQQIADMIDIDKADGARWKARSRVKVSHPNSAGRTVMPTMWSADQFGAYRSSRPRAWTGPLRASCRQQGRGTVRLPTAAANQRHSRTGRKLADPCSGRCAASPDRQVKREGNSRRRK